MSGNKPKFFEIKDATMLSKIYGVLVRHKVPITFWIKDQAIRFESRFHDFISQVNILKTMLPGSITKEEFAGALRAQGTSEVFGSMQIDNTMFFFKTQCSTSLEPGEINLQAPTEIFKLQRRVNLRIPFPRERAPRVMMSDPSKPFVNNSDMMTFRMLDLSVGGVGIAAVPEHKKMFKQGAKIQQIKFTVRGAEITTAGVVVHAFETKNDKQRPMLKVGIQFAPLPAEVEKELSRFVIDESRRYFSLLY